MESITVCARIRPKTNSQVKEDDNLWKFEANNIISGKSKEVFSFDKIIGPSETNEELFRNIIKENIENFLRGINVSIFAFGQTSTGKTHTMKGSNNNLNGIIPLAIGEIISRLSEEEKQCNNRAFKYSLKVSYVEIYNETVNDLLDVSKKNLEIRESLQRGVFINNLTEVAVLTYEKAIGLLKQGDNLRVVAETKLNEKSSRSHTLFRISLEVSRVHEGKQKTYLSQLNLIDLAGSENVSKAKTEGLRMKEGSNINKSLLALSNVIQKLSNNQKSFVNYRDSKLTRLLQPALSGNSKTMIICTITEAQVAYSETLNTLHFGIKAKNIKTSIKVNEQMDEKSKIILENTQLKSKIKNLEELIIENKTCEIKEKDIKTNLQTNQQTNKNDMISVLEKEVSLLKRILISNEEIGENDVNSVSNEVQSVNSQSINNNYNSSYYAGINYNNLSSQLMSATKYNPRSNMLMSSGKKMTDSARKIYKREEPGNMSIGSFNDPNESVFRRCMTDMKMNSFAPSVYGHTSRDTSMMNMNMNNMNMNMNSSNNPSFNNYIMNTAQKKNYGSSATPNMSNNNNFNLSAMKNHSQFNFDGENDFLYPGQNDNSFQLLKENDELRKKLFELRKNFLETVQNKENQIKQMNFYVTNTNDNCEKIIREAEENYMSLKINFERTREDVLNKDTEIKNLNQTVRSLEANTSFYKEEINNLNQNMVRLTESYKGDKMYKELECKFNEISKSYEALVKFYENDKHLLNEFKSSNDKLKNENDKIKMALENYKSENLSFKTQYDVMKKNCDLLSNESCKLKNDIESYKNEIALHKDKMNKLKSELNQLTKEKKGGKDQINNNNNNNSARNEEYESRISTQNAYIVKLEMQLAEYKNNLMKIEQTQIAEYQKLLDESFGKISELQGDLDLSLQKNNYLEKLVQLSNENNKIKLLTSAKQTPPIKEKENYIGIENKNISQFSFYEKNEKSDNKDVCNSIFTMPTLGLKDDTVLSVIYDNDNQSMTQVNENTSLISSNSKYFIGKKRKHLNRVYQSMIDKNLNSKFEVVKLIY